MSAASSTPVAVDSHALARLRAFQRQPLAYSVMSVYTIASIGLMATHSVGLTAEHVILIGILIGILAFALNAAERVSLRRTFATTRHVPTAPRDTLIHHAARRHLARLTTDVSRGLGRL